MVDPPLSSNDVLRVFVYGTLKRGQIREAMWPQTPIEILPAKTQGVLYDLGSYPAMIAGSDQVVGEVWRFAAEQMPETLRVLDQIEDYRDASDDLYKRVIVDCGVNGKFVQAYTYHYAMKLDQRFRIHERDGRCEWPPN